jgi:hypothetical protein
MQAEGWGCGAGSPSRRMHPAKAAVVAYRHQRKHMGPMIFSSHRADRDAPLRGDNDIGDRLNRTGCLES